MAEVLIVTGFLFGLALGIVVLLTLYRVYFTDPMDLYASEERLQRRHDDAYLWVISGELPPKDPNRG